MINELSCGAEEHRVQNTILPAELSNLRTRFAPCRSREIIACLRPLDSGLLHPDDTNAGILWNTYLIDAGILVILATYVFGGTIILPGLQQNQRKN